MAEVKGKAKNKGKLIVYIGNDEGYFDTLKHRFAKQFPRSEFSYHEINSKNKDQYQKIFKIIARAQPAIIYIDFSVNRLTQLKLARLLTRDNSTISIPTVGLVESKANIRECISSGVSFTHVKCGEYYDVVYDPFYLAFPKEATPPSFAKAKVNKPVELINDFRVGYITKDGIHAEGDIPLNIGDKIKLESSIPQSTIPSKNYIVKSVNRQNLYYDFEYTYDLDFVFVDEPELDESALGEALGEVDTEKREKAQQEAAKKSKELEAQYHDDIKRSKKKHKAWLRDKMIDSRPKKTKITIVDPGLKIFDEGQLIESYPFAIRAQSFLSEDLSELEKNRPHLIAFQFIRHDLFDKQALDITEATQLLYDKQKIRAEDEEEEGELSLEEKEEREKIINDEKEKSRTELLRLVNKIKSIDDYDPFLVIFNSFDYTSETLKDNFKYPLMISNKGHVNLKTVSELAGLFEKKRDATYQEKIKQKVLSLKKSDPHKYRNLTPADFDEDQVFIKKDDPFSYAAFSYPIELETMSETELTFKIDLELEHCVFRLDFPVPMTITLISNQDKKYQKDGKLYQYKALIHSVDENDKKLIRKAINEVFFDPLKKEREKEQEAYKEIHNKALKEKEESAKKEEQQKSLESDQEVSEYPEEEKTDADSETPAEVDEDQAKTKE